MQQGAGRFGRLPTGFDILIAGAKGGSAALRSGTTDVMAIARACVPIADISGMMSAGLDKTTGRSIGTGSTAGATRETCAPTGETAVKT